MAASYVTIGSYSFGTYLLGSGPAKHRQILVIGDPTTEANVAPVDAVNGMATHLPQYTPESGRLPVALSAAVVTALTPPTTVAVTGTFWQATQPVSVTSLPLPSGAATEATLATLNTASNFDTKTGSLTEAAPASDTASSGLNGRLQRIAQRITSLIGLLPSALTGSGNLKVSLQESNVTQTVTGTGGTFPITAASLPLPSGAATELTLATLLTESNFNGRVGATTETAPVTDTGTSGLNGRLQRIAERITTLINTLPNALSASGNLKVAVSESLPSGSAAIGKLAANDGVDIGDVTINNASIAVTGTFFQTTQPVSVAAGTTTIAKAEDAASANADVGVPAMAVQKATPANTADTDGDYTFLQMSGGRLWCSTTIDAALPGGTNAIGKLVANSGVTIGAVEIAAAQTLGTVSTVTNLAQLGGSAIAMNAGTRSAGTQRVTIATDDVVPAAQSGTWNIGTVTTITTVSTVTAVTAITNALPVGANRIGLIRIVDSGDIDLTAAKGSQTNRFVGTQDAKDSGRSQVCIVWEAGALGTSENTLGNFTSATLAGAAVTAATNYTVSAGKKLRIQQVNLGLTAAATPAANRVRVRIRQAASGIANTSPIIWEGVIAFQTTPAANGGNFMVYDIPEGLEVPAGQQITATWVAATATNPGTVDVSIIGYEY